MENNRNFPARQFHSLTFFAGLCISITPVAQALAAEGQANADDTLVVEASTPSLYAPQQSADPKFSRPVADTTRTMTVISEQVIKDQGATNLTDALKNVPGVGNASQLSNLLALFRGCGVFPGPLLYHSREGPFPSCR
ncbi:TonB-dependent receptor plug domain-containing protein [Escherichia coli]|nr:TonB-dependent receptor plug domain-containing protein [Escherichia coli]QMM17693.1 TonB-dependent receptor plug domain-containing protein [Escherichia coli]QMM28245.1 TonB-dependent receptor plug domain-containing protein [Escherichia coli]QMM33970.1 TonB-dependent receptor plug domain-containing protein [Escherichia coli]